MTDAELLAKLKAGELAVTTPEPTPDAADAELLAKIKSGALVVSEVEPDPTLYTQQDIMKILIANCPAFNGQVAKIYRDLGWE